MRPLVMDFSKDERAIQQRFEYMFGKALLVAPVTEAGVREWDVYLPKSASWYDLWTGKHFAGGQMVKADAAPDKIPVFVKSGSIIPFGKVMQYTGQGASDTLEIRVYKGANGKFELYEDEGDNYNYEKGGYTLIKFHWNDNANTLYIDALKGSFANYLKKRIFNIVLISGGKEIGITTSAVKKQIRYSGKSTVAKIE